MINGLIELKNNKYKSSFPVLSMCPRYLPRWRRTSGESTQSFTEEKCSYREKVTKNSCQTAMLETGSGQFTGNVLDFIHVDKIEVEDYLSFWCNDVPYLFKFFLHLLWSQYDSNADIHLWLLFYKRKYMYAPLC